MVIVVSISLTAYVYDDACLTSIKSLIDNCDRDLNTNVHDYRARGITANMRPILAIISGLEDATSYGYTMYPHWRTESLYDRTLLALCDG